MKNFIYLSSRVLTWVGLASLIMSITFIIIADVQLDRNCTGHLKRAADANTIELAASELEIAIQYLEDNDLTTGYTSILYTTPDEDIAFWYNNLKDSHQELVQMKNMDSVTNLEKSNQLMKLRETLIDHNGDKSGDQVTVPEGLSRYPDNANYAWWVNLSWILAVWGGISFIIYEEKYNW